MDKINYITDTYPFREIVECWFWDESILPLSGISNLHLEKTYDLLKEKMTSQQYGINVFIKKLERMIRLTTSI